VVPGKSFLSDLDRQLDPVAQELAKVCAADPVCGAKLGPDPWARLQDIMRALAQGHCPTFAHRDVLRRGDFLPGREDRIHMLALLYRLERCTPEDIGVVERYFDAWLSTRPIPGSGTGDSFALMMNVTFSELWPRPVPSTAELVARCEDQLFCPGVGVALSALSDAWRRYPLDRYYDSPFRTRTPVLMLHGELDTQTPVALARALAEQLNARHQTLVTIPYGTHAAAFSSPVRTKGVPNCGTQLLASFVGNPRGRLDTSCLGDLRPPFEIDQQLKQSLFGDADLWENEP
ncbi:MAG TPA: alpha/beta hydrolase, partial [Polyangiales bacterium]